MEALAFGFQIFFAWLAVIVTVCAVGFAWGYGKAAGQLAALKKGARGGLERYKDEL